ncbi:hypothetical protein EV715DRAFT_208660 [Schizophyllum commune]
MAGTEDKGVQTLPMPEAPRKPKHRARKSAQRKVERPGRPKFHKRLHPAHADIPFVPKAYDNNTTKYWHLGWPMSDAFVDYILKKYIPKTLAEERPPPEAKYASFMHITSHICRCDTLRLVLVQPDDSAPWQSPLAEDGERGVTFCMIVSDCSKYYFTKRPTKEQMGRMIAKNKAPIQGYSSVGTAESQSTKEARRPRPKYHKRLHCSHADIPFVPEERDKTPHRFWHFGWPVSDAFANNIINTYIPGFLDSDLPLPVRYARFMALAKGITQCDPDSLRIVLVEPDEYTPLGEYQSPFAEGEEKAVTFCMVVSDARKRFFTERPTKEQMGRLVSFFGTEARWKMDAREKSLWRRYGHGN